MTPSAKGGTRNRDAAKNLCRPSWLGTGCHGVTSGSANLATRCSRRVNSAIESAVSNVSAETGMTTSPMLSSRSGCLLS